MGAQRPRTLEDLRAQMDNPAIPPATGPFYPQPGSGAPGSLTALPAAPSEPEGFDAGDVWVFPYNLKPYVDAQGHVPPPTQARIDRFMRNMAKLMLEYEKAARDAAVAQAKAEKAEDSENSAEWTVEEALSEVDTALEEKNAAVDKVRAAIADLCNGHPTRKQLEKLPEYVLMKFSSVLGRKVNPEG